MNEIDDTYKQESETLDTDFIEGHNLGITKESTIKKYLSGIRSSRDKFQKKYKRHLKKEKWKVLHPKKKKKKKAKSKVLRVKHFDFRFNFFQRLIMKMSVSLFNVSRIFVKFFVMITPSILLYVFYKITKSASSSFSNSRIFIDRKKKDAAESTKKFFKDLFAKVKSDAKKTIAKINSIIPGKKEKDGEKGKEGDKDTEKKDEKDEDKKEEP